MPKLKYSSLCFVSRNKNKYREYCVLLGFSDLKLAEIEIEEPQSMNLHVLVEEKIKIARPQLPNIPFFVEHTGLLLDAWKGLPGGLTRSFMETVGNEGICKMMQAYKGAERTARAIVVIGYSHPGGGVNTFEGEVTGTIALEPRGTGKFGWDPIFIPEGDTKTYAEMSLTEKNRTSMRRDAVEKFAKFLSRHFEL